MEREHAEESALPAVLILSLGPVQDFIATARRCRDLWFGSWMLSELSKAAAAAVKANHGDMIFPPPSLSLKPDSGDAVANKIVAVVPGDAGAIADAAREAAQSRLREMFEATVNRLDPGKTVLRHEIMRAQIEDLLEWNWAAAPLGQGGFAVARSRADHVLAARKTCRDFGPATWAGKLPKSSLDGAREAVIEGWVYKQYKDSPVQLRQKFGVRPGEQLCGVGFLKRNGERGHQDSRIASTSHVAAQALVARWKRELIGDLQKEAAAKNAWREYCEVLREQGVPDSEFDTTPVSCYLLGHSDAHFLFPGRLEGWVKGKDALKLVQEKRRAFLCAAAGGGRAVEPHPYVAILKADGDHMGRAISACTEVEKNQRLSELLAGFSSQARDIVNGYAGTLIYAGGDDVLALLPVDTALDCAKALEEAFEDRFAGLDLEKAPTLSAGIAVVHHSEPLSEGLELANKAEKAAKGVKTADKEKHALAVLVEKRSGGTTLVADHWGDGESGLASRLETLAHKQRAGVIPRGLPYEWRSLAARMGGQAAGEADLEQVNRLLRGEAIRVLKRKYERGGERKVQDSVVEKLTDLLKEYSAIYPRNWLDRIVSELLVAGELAAAYSIARKPEKHLPGENSEVTQ